MKLPSLTTCDIQMFSRPNVLVLFCFESVLDIFYYVELWLGNVSAAGSLLTALPWSFHFICEVTCHLSPDIPGGFPKIERSQV